ncbi:MAG: hypothetical protein WA990_15865 [Rubrobacteraceae bacterium]
MGEERISVIERILQRVEEHHEEWRRQDTARKAEAEAQRQTLWEEAREREKLLAEAVAEEEGRRGSEGEIAGERGVVFVAHSGDAGESLEEFAREGDPLVKVVPGRGFGGDGTGMKGSWLVFGTRE